MSLRHLAAALAATTAIAVGVPSAVWSQSSSAPAASAPSSTPAAAADADMGKVLAALAALGPKPIESLSPAEARRQPSAADAAMKVIKDDKVGAKPHAGLTVTDKPAAETGGHRLRWYVPQGTTANSNLPVIVYFRGGGWVIADLDTYDATPSALARKTGAAVVSVDYPLAPERKFPAAHEEAVRAYTYVTQNAKGWGYDPAKIAIVGESAGGNLAVNTALAARDQNLTKPVAVVSVYPVAATTMDTPSKRDQANAKPLNTAMLTWFFSHVLAKDADKQDPRLNLVAADLKGLPPVTVINAELDPLRSDGDMLVEKLKAAGVETTHKLYTGVTHEFFGMDAVVAKAGEAQDFAVAQLKKGFGGAR